MHGAPCSQGQRTAVGERLAEEKPLELGRRLRGGGAALARYRMTHRAVQLCRAVQTCRAQCEALPHRGRPRAPCAWPRRQHGCARHAYSLRSLPKDQCDVVQA
eukprot:scaffold5891_cov121-Isochrysis_galbana.AAC.3